VAGKGSVIVLEQRLVKSAVWLSLGGTAKDVYLLFRTKCRIMKRQTKPQKHGPVIANNGELEFTYDEAQQKYRITTGRFTRALDQLVDRGFIDVTATGMGVHRVKTWYAISDRWRDYGTPNFKPAIRPKPSISNPGFKKGNKLWIKARKKTSSAENEHGAVRNNAHGDVLAMRTDAHGQKIAILYKFRENRWLASRIA
jgi:DNA-binding PadR family transcriptional regulator